MTDLPAVQQLGLTDEQRAIILRHVRSGIDLEAAAVEVGVDVVTAFRDPELVRLVPEAYAVGTARLRKIALETAIKKGDATALMRFIDKREQATQAALASLQEKCGSPLEDFLVSHGLTPPEGRSAVEWFVELALAVRDGVREKADIIYGKKLNFAEDLHLKKLLEANNYEMVWRPKRNEFAKRVLSESGYVITRFKKCAPQSPMPAPDVPDVVAEGLPEAASASTSRFRDGRSHRDPDSLHAALLDGRVRLIGRR